MVQRSITSPRILLAWAHGSNRGQPVRLFEITSLNKLCEGMGMAWRARKDHPGVIIDRLAVAPALCAAVQRIAHRCGSWQLDRQRKLFLNRLMRVAQTAQRVFDHGSVEER
ncbi:MULTISPECIES: hypothetical protein [unclassified Variovorax]|uniref:hypothetical protein n=1 Tax=unclassified Variovorax TaxID=663243 RepID=UPI000BE48A56|nr:hypothetical protein [Variovorax sp. YR752]